MQNISELIFERQMSMFGHVARLSSDYPAYRILSCSNPVVWKRVRGRPLSSWLRQMEGFCRRVGLEPKGSRLGLSPKMTHWLTGIVGGVRLRRPLLGVQAPESK